MKRRGFLSLIGLAGAPALAAAGATTPHGFTWTQICHNPECATPLSQFIDLRGPLKVGNQCPKCLWVMNLEELGREITKRHKQEI